MYELNIWHAADLRDKPESSLDFLLRVKLVVVTFDPKDANCNATKR